LSVLHRLSQRLPHSLRRNAFGHAALAAARLKPASAESAPAGAPVVVAGALRAPTGLGQAARLAILALKAEGHPVAALDLTAALRQPAIVEPPAAPRAESGPGMLLVFANPPVSSFVLSRIPSALLAGKQRIGCFVWEYDNFPKSWRSHASLFNRVCAPTEHGCKVMSQALGQKVHVLPHPVALTRLPERTTRLDRAPGTPFTVGFVGDMVAAWGRKNPLAAIRAMALAFAGDPAAQLMLILNGASEDHPEVKVLRGEAEALHVPLTIDARLLSDAENLARYALFDAYLSLHRAEGFGLTIGEAMLATCPVVATAAPPVDGLIDHATAFPVPWTMVPAPALPDLAVPGDWAEPDLAAAAAHLRAIRADPALAAARAETGRLRMLEGFGARAFCASLGLQPRL